MKTRIIVKVVSSKWKKHYDLLIERGRNRVLDGYCERHHIVPRCMQGSDEPTNLVDLTPEEHYVAHQLLVKIYPHHGGLVKGASALLMNSPTTPRKNKVYGWIKKRLSVYQREVMISRHQKVPHPMLGRKQTAEAKAAIGTASSARQKKQVFCFSTDTGELVKTFLGVTDAAKWAGVHDQTLFSCIRVPGKRTAGGFSWSYKNESPGPLVLTQGGRVSWKQKEL